MWRDLTELENKYKHEFGYRNRHQVQSGNRIEKESSVNDADS